MRRIILHMIATNALAAFSVPTGSVGAARPIIPARAGDVAKGASMGASAAGTQTLPRLPPAPPAGGGKILPRGSLLDLSV
ncbi:MAG: hypothetical protein ACREFU_10980 [Acetobacteraceae bacterium]